MYHRLKELISYVRRNEKLFILVVILGQVAISLSLTVNCLKSDIKTQSQAYNETYTEGNYFVLGDWLIGDEEAEFTKNPNYKLILKQLNEMLHSSEYFKYLELREDSLSILNYTGPDNNLYGYENGDSLMYKAAEEGQYSTVKAYMLGCEVFDHFNISIEAGRLFTEEDYMMDNLTTMPVILGSNYKDTYAIGDIFEGKYLFFSGNIKVIGFLSDDATLCNSYEQVSLSRYIIFPLFTPSEESGSQAYRRQYFQKNNGLLYSKYSAEDLQNIINDFCDELGIKGKYFVCGATNQYNNSTGMTLEELTNIITYITVGISIFTTLLFSIYISIKIIKSSRYYAILLINGFTLGDILWMIQAEIILILFVICSGGILIGYFICSVLFPNNTFHILIGIVPAMSSMILVVPISLLCYLKTDLAIYLRKE